MKHKAIRIEDQNIEMAKRAAANMPVGINSEQARINFALSCGLKILLTPVIDKANPVF